MGNPAFGPGILIATRTDISNPTPINVGYAQEFSPDMSGNTKMLYGQNQFPLAAARSTIKATGKFKSAVVSGLALNTLFFGQTLATGGQNMVVDEAATIPGTPYQVTVSGSATFVGDLGVRYASSGLPMIRVASGPTVGQYSVSAGVYTFAAADTLLDVLINYSKTVLTGASMAITNTIIGLTPTFQLDYYTSFAYPTQKAINLTLYSCIASKVTMPFKLEDFMIPEFDFDFFALPNGNVFKISFPDYS